MLVGTFSVVPGLPVMSDSAMAPEEPELMQPVSDLDVLPQNMQDALASALQDDLSPGLDVTDDVGLVLKDNPNDYKVTYEPWKTKAAIHALAYDEDSGFLALGGGYLYDNEIHIYRFNPTTGEFDKVWDSGDGIIKSDVISLAIGDTDLNDFMEIVAASSDGRVYVFEQRHIYDPYANTENMFDFVWSSPYTFRAFAVAVDDVDRDYRPDIVVGSWDGKVRCFEYDNHSGYPFSEEHWITYREVWNSGDTIDGKVYTIATGDTNNNGLPEIIAGTREGRVYVFENDGITMWINGEPFPLVNDNHYKVVWTSENYTWTPIIDMEAGELDGSSGEEIALVAQGQGVFVLDWDALSQTYTYEKVYRPWDAWQSESPSPWRLDFWADSIVSAHDVFYHLNNGSFIPEPISYTMVGGYADPDAECYPFNTGLANETDGYYSIFDASSADNATAIVDFGNDEEGTGSANSDWDVVIQFKDSLTSSIYSSFNFSVSQSGTDWEQVDTSRYSYSGDVLYIDVDDALSARKWDWFRYVKIAVFNGQNYSIDSVKLNQVYTQVTTALTVTIGPLPESLSLYGSPDDSNKLLVGTVIGTVLAFRHGSSYDLIWDSGADDNFAAGTNIWDMVYVGSKSRLPMWWWLGSNQVSLPGGTNYGHWSYGDVDPTDWVGSVNPYNLIFVNDVNDITVYSVSASSIEEDTTKTGYFSPITPDTGYDIVSVEIMPDMDNPSLPYALVTFRNTDVNVGETFDAKGTMAGDLIFYRRPDELSGYTWSSAIEYHDYTGDIVDALATTKAGPYLELVDWDGDGDKDMILSTGFLYYCENVQGEPGVNELEFKLHPGYFEEINNGEMNYFWGQPSAGDFDNDGDLDLVVGYEGKPGFTYWENTGTVDAPVWKEDPRLFKNTDPDASFRYNEMYDPRIVPRDTGLTGDYVQSVAEDFGLEPFTECDYYLLAFRPASSYLFNFWPIYDQSAGYVVATYPEVKRYQFAPLDGSSGVFNYGYHVFETWSTDDDLNGWTLSVTSGDVDGDGKGELIVGDYDNNIYIFEHMVNNSYKRAFRSFDVNYTVQSSTSPYYWEELEGIDGTFDRVIWSHVDQLLAGTDLDGDGLSELVAAADMQLYVFEDTGIDDTYRLVYTIDFRDSQFNTTVGWSHVSKITALGAGNDFDYNNMNELLVGVGPYLFVYNIPYNSWSDAAEYFMGNALSGKYYLLGNGADTNYKDANIQVLLSGDTDEDGYRELILGGTLNVSLGRSDGFVKIYEWTGLTFDEVWSAPSELTFWNPISDIVIDDQDFDSRQELIIGHTKGFDIWEWDGTDSGYEKVEFVTSSPNYPYIDVKSSRLGAENGTNLAGRGQNDIEYWKTDSDSIYGVYVNVSPSGYLRFYGKIYVPSSDVWIPQDQLFPNNYNHFPSYSVYNEQDPKLHLHPNGTLYLTWRTRMWTGSSFRYDFWWSKFDYNLHQWNQPEYITSATTRRQPHLFFFPDGTAYVIYLSDSSHQLYFGFYNTGTGAWDTGHTFVYPDYSSYYVTSFDFEQMNDGGWAMAISARNASVAKTDLDIYVATANSTLFFGSMYQATSSYNDEIFPDISQLASPDDTLMVLYEVPAAEVEDRVQMSYSLAGTYAMWRKGEPMASIPEYIFRKDNGNGEVTYMCEIPGNDPVPIMVPYAFFPSIVGLRDGGFIYTYVFDFVTRSIYDTPYHSGKNIDGSYPYYPSKLYDEYADYVYGINPSSRFAHYNIRSVVDLDVGDSDGDNRREVTVVFDDRAATYELEYSNSPGSEMNHVEAWMSEPLGFDATGVTVYDLNGNGYEEIGVSCERGETFVFEVDNTGIRPVDLHLADLAWNNTGGTDIQDGVPQGFIVYDIDGDGYDEIIRGEYDGTVRAIDDDGTDIWTNTDVGSYVYDMAISNTSAGLVLAVSYEKFNYTLIDVTTGATLWNTTLPGFKIVLFITTYYPGRVIMADVSDAPGTEIIGASTVDTVRVWAQNGTELWTYDLGNNFLATGVAAGNFSGRGYLDLAVIHANNTLSFLYGNNGTLIRHLEGNYGASYVSPVVFDYNGDGYDDIAMAHRRLTIVDGHTGDLLYNSTVELPNNARHIWISNFDDDVQPEALLTTDDGVYYEELTSGRQVWSYEPKNGQIEDAFFGMLSSGRPGLALALDSGCVVALDALTGLPVYFEITDFSYDGVAAADIDDDGVDELIGSTTTGQLLAYEEMVPSSEQPPEALYTWTKYWQETMNITIGKILPRNLDSDSRDEILITYGTTIQVWEPLYPQVMWTYDAPGVPYDVSFGDFNDDGTDDVIFTYERPSDSVFGVLALDGSTGVPLSAINETFEGGTLYGVATGDFDPGQSGTEYALLMKFNTQTGVAVYSNNGAKLYITSTNTTNASFDIVVGEFDGSSGLDFVVGTEFGFLFYSGDCTYLGFRSVSGTLYYMETGEFNGDSYTDLVGISTDYSVRTVDGQTRTSFWIHTYTAQVDGVAVGNFYTSNTQDEVVVSVRNEGLIKTYGNVYSVIDQKTLSSPTGVWIDTADLDSDGTPDIVAVQQDHIAVFDTATWNPIAVYGSTDPVHVFAIGNFDDTGTLDIAFSSDMVLNTVTNGTQPPAIPQSTGLTPSDVGGLGLTTVMAIGGIPLLIGAVLFEVRRRRRRILQE